MDESADRVEHELTSIEIVDGVLVFNYKEGIFVDETSARSIIASATELVGARAPIPTLVVLRRIKGTNKAARDFFANSPENRALSSRVAMVIKSPVARMIANFFIGLNKTGHPTRLFNDEPAARAWLES